MSGSSLKYGSRRDLTVDCLKGIAALIVFLLHGRSYVPTIDQISGCLAWISYFPAWGGVWIFLILSGYGIGLGFFTGKYSLQDSSRHEKLKQIIKFYIGRLIKIAPLYYLYCFLFEIFSNQSFFWHNPKILFRMFTFTFNGNGGVSGLGHLWYISMAMQLYLFMPFIYFALEFLCKTKKVSAIIYIVILISGMVLRLGLYKVGCDWQAGIYTNCLVNLDLVILGMLTAKVKVTGYLSGQESIQRKMSILGAVLFIILVLYNCYIYHDGMDRDFVIYRYILPSVYMCVCTLLLLSSGNRIHKYRRTSIQKAEMIINIAICKFSSYSFAFYIFHISIFEYLNRTLVSMEWFCNYSPDKQYFIFFAAAFLILLIPSIIFTCWSGRAASFLRSIQTH